MQISVVIPTRNRADSLKNLIFRIAAQTFQPAEIIIVDASDDTNYLEGIKREFAGRNITCIISEERSVCVQRNKGINSAASDWIFLCDDDIEIPADHFEKLSQYLVAHPECGALCGACLQMEKEFWVAQYPVKNFPDLLWRYVFQLSVWSDLSEVKPPLLMSWLHRRIRSFYQRRGNTLSMAGWPLITQWNESVMTSATYALGASLICRQWLIDSPYDEVLDASGIGDNYGVALNFKQATPIHILTQTPYYHHRAGENRLDQSDVYYRRALALNYFTILKGVNAKSKTSWLVWSLTGSYLRFLISGKWPMANAAGKAIITIISGKNPYWLAHLQGRKIVTPL